MAKTGFIRAAVNQNNNQFDPTALVAGDVYSVSCNSIQQLSLSGATTSNMVIITIGRLNFGSGASLDTPALLFDERSMASGGRQLANI